MLVPPLARVSNIENLGQCQVTAWFGLRRAILGQPLAHSGVLMVASGGLPVCTENLIRID
jgi:hypothetical protein